MSTPLDPNKTQMNFYTLQELKDHVDKMHMQTGLTKSDIMNVLIIYMRKFWTPEILKDMAMHLSAFGEDGLERVA